MGTKLDSGGSSLMDVDDGASGLLQPALLATKPMQHQQDTNKVEYLSNLSNGAQAGTHPPQTTDTPTVEHESFRRRPWLAGSDDATGIANLKPRQVLHRKFILVKTPIAHGSNFVRQDELSGQSLNSNMTEFADHRDHRRGGGGYAGRKRRFREDDDFERRPQMRRHYERPEHPSARARRYIWGIAENPTREIAREVIDISKLLADHAEDEKFCDIISNNIVQLVQEQPFKTPFVATVVLYTNLQKPALAQLILSKTATRTQAVLDAGEWRVFKLLLRFLGCMQPMFQDGGVFATLDELFDRAADLQSASSEDTLGLELVKIILLTLPYVVAITDSKFTQQATEVLSKTDIIASAPREIDSLVDPFIRSEGSEAPVTPSFISLLQKQLQNEVENEWKMSFIPRLFKPESLLGDAAADTEVKTYPFPALTLPDLSNGRLPLFPEVFLSIYADQDIETVPPTRNLAACLLRDTLNDTINILDFNRTAAAKFLIGLDCYFAPDTFVARGTPLDTIKNLSDDKAKWKSEDVAVDAIFSQMLQLPAPEHKLVYYHAIITEACKIAPMAIAPCLGRAIRFLYRNLEDMDVELSNRFMDWFSHHLSNFDFKWKWGEWVEDVNRDAVDPPKAFILGALDKEVRLSFAKRIRQTLLEEYQPLVPASKDNDIPEFKFNNELSPYSAEAKQLVRLLRKKAPDSEVGGILTTIASQAQNPDDASDPNTNPPDDPAALLPAIDIFATTICYIGSKSLSHVLSYIERQKERLMLLSQSGPEAQKQIITSVVDYWKEVQPGVAVNIIDKLLNYTILTPQSVIEWALDPHRLEGGRLLSISWVYEMVDGTVRKVTGRVRQILTARQQRGVPAVQVELLEKTLADDKEAMRRLFNTIGDALGPVTDGSADGILEGEADMNGLEKPEEERRLCRLWGVKWARVFGRKARVEDFVLAEGSKSFPPPAEEDPEVLANGVSGGDENMENGEPNGLDAAAGVAAPVDVAVDAIADAEADLDIA